VSNSGVVSYIYTAKSTGPDELFGIPERIPLYYDVTWLEPEAPTLSSDGTLLMFSRIDCRSKNECKQLNIYKLDRLSKPDAH